LLAGVWEGFDAAGAGTALENMMKAIVQDKCGSPDVLALRDIGHRQTKEAATEKPTLLPPRHISTLPIAPAGQ